MKQRCQCKGDRVCSECLAEIARRIADPMKPSRRKWTPAGIRALWKAMDEKKAQESSPQESDPEPEQLEFGWVPK